MDNRSLQRLRSFTRIFVRLSGAHCHAKRLTSEHLLLLQAFLPQRARTRSHVESGESMLGKGQKARVTVPTSGNLTPSRCPVSAGRTWLGLFRPDVFCARRKKGGSPAFPPERSGGFCDHPSTESRWFAPRWALPSCCLAAASSRQSLCRTWRLSGAPRRAEPESGGHFPKGPAASHLPLPGRGGGGHSCGKREPGKEAAATAACWRGWPEKTGYRKAGLAARQESFEAAGSPSAGARLACAEPHCG